MQPAIDSQTLFDQRAKPIQTFCNIPKLAKHDHTKTFKVIGTGESQFLLGDKPAFHFEHVWGEGTTGEIYDRFTRPAIADLVRGRSTLLFVVGRNKKHRGDVLFGETKDSGLIPLSVNALYNSIGEHRALKYYFKPLGHNTYKIQSDAHAMFERHQRDVLSKVSKNVLGNLTHTSTFEKSILDQTVNVSGIDDENIYTVFVSAMEINSSSNLKSSTSDLLKMFTEGIHDDLIDQTPETCIEIEFDDARKTRRKLADTNKLPTKEHATRVYTIRLVQARKTDQIENVVPIVSQLTFVDLPTNKNAADLKAIKDFIVPPRKNVLRDKYSTEYSNNHLRDFLLKFPIQDQQLNFTPIKLLLCASASANDAEETLQDIKWVMSLQAYQYLVYLGRDDDQYVSRDNDHHRPPRPPPPPVHYSTSLHRADHATLTATLTPSMPQHVPSPTPIAQSTPRSLPPPPPTLLPSSSTSSSTGDHQRSLRLHHQLYQTVNETSSRSFVCMTDASQSMQKPSVPPQSQPTSSTVNDAQRPSRRYQQTVHSTLHRLDEHPPPVVTYPATPSTAKSHLTQTVPPRPPPLHRTPQTVSSIERQTPNPVVEDRQSHPPSTSKSKSTISHRRPPPPPPLPAAAPARPPPSKKFRLSRKHQTPNTIADIQRQQQRASSAVGSRTTTTTAPITLREEHLLKRSSSADRIGRERWLHHITDSSATTTIKLRTSLPNPLQLVTNHFDAMSKLLSATKYAIEHRGKDEKTKEDIVQLFQGDVMATSKGGVKVVFTSVDKVTHDSLLPIPCENSVSER